MKNPAAQRRLDSHWRSGWDSNPRAVLSAKRFRVVLVMTPSIPLHIFFRQKALQNSRKFWRELAERTTKIFKFEPTKNLGKTRKTLIQNAQYAEGFRVSPVMTASIPLHSERCYYSRVTAENQEEKSEPGAIGLSNQRTDRPFRACSACRARSPARSALPCCR